MSSLALYYRRQSKKIRKIASVLENFQLKQNISYVDYLQVVSLKKQLKIASKFLKEASFFAWLNDFINDQFDIDLNEFGKKIWQALDSLGGWLVNLAAQLLPVPAILGWGVYALSIMASGGFAPLLGIIGLLGVKIFVGLVAWSLYYKISEVTQTVYEKLGLTATSDFSDYFRALWQYLGQNRTANEAIKIFTDDLGLDLNSFFSQLTHKLETPKLQRELGEVLNKFAPKEILPKITNLMKEISEGKQGKPFLVKSLMNVVAQDPITFNKVKDLLTEKTEKLKTKLLPEEELETLPNLEDQPGIVHERSETTIPAKAATLKIKHVRNL